MTVAVIVQARMTSVRLPGKSMLPLGGKPVIWHVLDRCQRIPGVDVVVCAVPQHGASRPIAELAMRLGVSVYFGSEHDVLDRYYHAARSARADIIVRVTGDCPLIDPDICGRVLSLVTGDIQYASNVMPRGYPKGLDCEAFTFEALESAYRDATDDYDREHTTSWMQRNFSTVNLPGDGDPEVNLCLDTPADYERLKAMF